jgi:hypothetical protein
MHKYKLKYNIDFIRGDYTPADVEGTDSGLTDALLCFSIIYPEDGGYSQVHFSNDGRTGQELTQEDLFKVWMTLGMNLANNGKLKGWHKKMIDNHAKISRELIVGKK